ncbi:MAG: TIGR02530 family flagellar biosynthesis protein [Candidatus Caldarchaeum sp.]
MADRIQNPRIREVVGHQQVEPRRRPAEASQEKSANFSEILQREMGLKLSGHAQTRLASRGIALNREDWNRVLEGVERAASKGSRESLVMLDDVAFIISIRNRTVITAVMKDQLKESVFTNIDSAVFV